MGLAALALSWTFCTAGIIGLVRLDGNVQLIHNLAALEAARGAARLALVDQETGVRGYVTTRNRMFLDVYGAGRARLANARRDELAASSNEGELRGFDAERAQTVRRVESFFADEMQLMRHGRNRVAVRQLSHGKAAIDAFRSVDTALRTRIAARKVQAQRAFDAKLMWAQRAIWLMIGLSALLAACLTLLIRASARIEREATRDPLTELANRRSLNAHMRRMAVEAAHAGERVGIITIDLDDFKRINDTYGHQRGDTLLCKVASRLLSALRHTDIVARLGGDEFAIAFRLRYGATPDALVACVRNVFVTPFSLDSKTTVQASCSLGVSVSDADLSVDALLAAADERMYVEKRSRDDALPQSVPAVRERDVAVSCAAADLC